MLRHRSVLKLDYGAAAAITRQGASRPSCIKPLWRSQAEKGIRADSCADLRLNVEHAYANVPGIKLWRSYAELSRREGKSAYCGIRGKIFDLVANYICTGVTSGPEAGSWKLISLRPSLYDGECFQ